MARIHCSIILTLLTPASVCREGKLTSDIVGPLAALLSEKSANTRDISRIPAERLSKIGSVAKALTTKHRN